MYVPHTGKLIHYTPPHAHIHTIHYICVSPPNCSHTHPHRGFLTTRTHTCSYTHPPRSITHMPLNTFLHTYTPSHPHVYPPLPTIIHTQPCTHILMHTRGVQLDTHSWPARHLPFPAELWMKSEAGGGWAPGWAAGVRLVWTDTPRWRGGGVESCPDRSTRIPPSQGQGDLPDYTCPDRLLGGQKGGGVTSQ